MGFLLLKRAYKSAILYIKMLEL